MNEKNNKFNNVQINLVRGTIHDRDDFLWDDSYIFNILKSEIPKLKLTGYEIKNKEYRENIKLLSELIDEFNNGSINYIDYKKQESKILLNLTEILNNKEVNDNHIYLGNYYNQRAVDEILNFSQNMFIVGDGGIGKSFLLYKFVEILKQSNVSYICSFGKFNTDFDCIDLDNVLETSKDKFVYFIIDAINEYSPLGRKKIKDFVAKNIDNPNIKFILSYRNYSLTDSELNDFINYFNNTYELFGVDVESALLNLIDDYGVDVTKYEGIINFQNPLYIKLLRNCLSDKKIVHELVNSESQITFIYEQFIKRIDKKLWECTKNQVSKYLYENEVKKIEENQLKRILGKDYIFYVDSLQQAGLLSSYEIESNKYYYFTIDTMNDFIIGRSFFESINGLNDDEIIIIINSKLKKLYSLSVVLIICLFDKFNDDVKRVFNIIRKSDLKYSFDISILRMIKFERKQSIDTLQQLLKFDLYKAINNLVGYHNKPFNFCNFFNNYFLTKDKYLSIIYNTNYRYIDNSHLKRKAKIISSLTKRYTYNSEINENEIFKEYFWFSFWFMGSSNTELSDLSKKNVYEICSKCNCFYDEIVNIYNKIEDEYIKNSIIEIICTSSQNIINKYKSFLISVYNNENEINSLRLVRIDNALFYNKRDYIKCNKKNLILSVEEMTIDKTIEKLLFRVELNDKYLLPWRYWSSDHIDCNLKFIKNNKDTLTTINETLTNKYPCLIKSVIYCKYNKEDLLAENNFNIKEIKIENKEYLLLFQYILKYVSKKYDFDLENEIQNIGYEHFTDSFSKKVITITRQILEGTLMCNYYTEEFCINKNTFENKVGYEIYNPYEYDDSFDLNYVHPYSVFNELADKLDQKLENRIEQSVEKEEDWENNVKDIKNNLFKIISSINIGKQEWVLLSVSLRYIYKENNDVKWMDTYLINSTYNCKKELTGIDDRYLTIELCDYNNSIEDYKNFDSEECSIMKPIKYSSGDFPENQLVLPPSNLVREFGLQYRTIDSTWIDDSGNAVIISNNNSKKRYNDIITNSLYIRKEYYEKIKEKLIYFSFTSRSKGEGYSEKSEFHMQFNNIVGEIKTISNKAQKTQDHERCSSCEYDKIQTEKDLEEIRNNFYNFFSDGV